MNSFVTLRGEDPQPPCPAPIGSITLSRHVARERAFKAGHDVLRQGDRPTSAYLLLAGCTYHYGVLEDGRRQITAVQVPGDVCDLAAVMRGRSTSNVRASSDCVVGEIPADHIANAGTSDPALTALVWRRLLREDAIAREWLVGLGRRDALARVAHLFCELRTRMEQAGLVLGGTAFPFLFTQVELADAVGLSTVHVNRILQSLRRSGLIRWVRGTLTILDARVLEAVAGFDPAYLHTA